MNKNRAKYDLAYGCFSYCGFAALVVGVVSAMPMDSDAAGVFGFLLAIPLALGALAAMLVGLALSALLWKHWPLLILSAMTILFVAEVVTEYGSVALYNIAPLIYGIGTLVISGIWFAILRAKYFPMPTDVS